MTLIAGPISDVRGTVAAWLRRRKPSVAMYILGPNKDGLNTPAAYMREQWA